MILNTGSRTDIPAYYSDWFYERVRAGEVLVRNPYYPTQITRYRLDPAVVDALVFCTKNPLPMLERLPLLDAFTMFWFVTITPYGREIAVSYTHLDVYKRQHFPSDAGGDVRGSVLFLCGYGCADQGALRTQQTGTLPRRVHGCDKAFQYCNCLLYTSYRSRAV